MSETETTNSDSYAWAEQALLNRKRAQPKRWTEKEIEKVLELRRQRVINLRIASQMGVTYHQVTALLVKLKAQGRLPKRSPDGYFYDG